MSKLLRISRHEYWKIVGTRGFWLGTLAFPGIIVIFAFLGIFVLAVVGRDTFEAVGFVDRSGVVEDVEETFVAGINIRPYPNEASAEAALQAEEIQGFYVLPEDYLQTHALDLYVLDDLPPVAETSFATFLQTHLLSQTDDAIRVRLLDGANLSVEAINEAEQDDDRTSQTLVRGIILFIALFSMMFILADIAGYSSMIVEDERENRTLEMMVTTLTANQFIVGKIVGLIGVTITRPMLWFLMALPFMVSIYMRVPETYQQMIDWSFILLIFFFVIPGITLFFGLMTVASVAINDPRYSGQMSGLLSTTLMFSMFVGLSLLIEEENTVAVALSFFPLTSFMVIVMRQTVAEVPTWQILLSWLILVVSTWGSLWLSVRFFKAGYLYSKRPFAWRTIWQKMRLRRSA